jgi:RimJ/RimL family protein N-acetyltransferase
MKIRHALVSDSKYLWQWRNDPQTRQNSVNQDEVSWGDHNNWFTASQKNDAREIFIGLNNETNELVGMVRFDFNIATTTSKVSLNLNPDWRGKNISSLMLSMAIDKFQNDRFFLLIAEILAHNTQSIKTFKRCGFALEDDTSDLLIFKNKQGIIDAIEGVRSANNVNWMDLIRLAFRVAPKEANEIVGKINTGDGQIANLLKRLGE